MSIIRRIYLYAVSFVSLETVLWGTIGLLRALFAGATGEDLAGSLSLIMVGAPVFLLHWRLVQREVRADEDERSSRLRALFLYGALLAAVLPAAQNLLALIDRAVRAVLDLPLDLALIGGDQT